MAKTDKKDMTREVSGKVYVSRMYGDKDIAEQEKLEIRKFEVEPAYVNVKYGLTISLGDYESARCDAGVSLPCYVEEIEDAYKVAWKMAEEEIQKQVRKVHSNE